MLCRDKAGGFGLRRDAVCGVVKLSLFCLLPYNLLPVGVIEVAGQTYVRQVYGLCWLSAYTFMATSNCCSVSTHGNWGEGGLCSRLLATGIDCPGFASLHTVPSRLVHPLHLSCVWPCNVSTPPRNLCRPWLPFVHRGITCSVGAALQRYPMPPYFPTLINTSIHTYAYVVLNGQDTYVCTIVLPRAATFAGRS